MRRIRVCLALVLFGNFCQATAGCHIHAPDDYPHFGGRPLVIPVTGDRSACQALNRNRFGSRGKCHCFEDTPLGAAMPAYPDVTEDPNAPESLPLP